MRVYLAYWSAMHKLLAELDCRVLLSYANPTDPDKKNPSIPNGFTDIMIDSGAYSVAQKTCGRDVTVEAYSFWLQQLLPHHPEVSVYANLDVVWGGKAWYIDEKDEREWNPKKGLENLRYMESQGLHPLPVWHMGEDFCVSQGTLVITSRGNNKRIEEIKVGDKLIGWDGAKAIETNVTEIAKRTVNTAIKLELEGKDKELIVTSGHPFYVCGKGWVKAKDLHVGDELLKVNWADKNILLNQLGERCNSIGLRGKKRDPSVVKKIVETWKARDLWKKVGEKLKGENNPSRRPEVIAKRATSFAITFGEIRKAKSRRIAELAKLREDTGKQNPRLAEFWSTHRELILQIAAMGRAKLEKLGKLGFRTKPTERERRVIESCKDLPILYVGNGALFIWNNGKCRIPDFRVDGQKKIIEVCSVGQGNAKYKEEAIRFYGAIGWKCLVLNISRISDIDIEQRVSEFIHNGMKVTNLSLLVGTYKVYNLQCEPYSNYFVSPTKKYWENQFPAVLSHNCYLNHYCNNYEYVGIGGVFQLTRGVLRRNWEYIAQTYPNNKFHIFAVGMAAPFAFQAFQPYSIDNSSWMSPVRWGTGISGDDEVPKHAIYDQEVRDAIRVDPVVAREKLKETILGLKKLETLNWSKLGKGYQKVLL